MKKRYNKYIPMAVITTMIGGSILNYACYDKPFKESENIIQNTNLNLDIKATESAIVLVNNSIPATMTGPFVFREEDALDGYTSARVNVRQYPNLDSKILTVLDFNTHILYMVDPFNKDWAIIKYNNNLAYVSTKYISNQKYNYKEYNVPNNSGFKSYMSYKTLTLESSKQYKLQNNYAYTGTYGVRQVNSRYCIALGSYFNADIGQYVDVVLNNGTVIPCIVGDRKADIHTDANNIFTSNGCCTEFIVDMSVLNTKAKNMGNMSVCCEEWNSSVKKIIVYETNIFN